MTDKLLIPETWRNAQRWCSWRVERRPNGKPTKVPDQSTRALDRCRRWEDLRGPQRGLILTGGLPAGEGAWWLCLDLDAAAERGELLPWAAKVIEPLRQHVAVELSPSGRGAHAWLRAAALPTYLRGKVAVDAPSIERKRAEVQVFGVGVAQYVAVTAQWLPGFGHIHDLPVVDEPTLRAWAAATGLMAEDAPRRELTAGYGPPPHADEIRRRVEAHPLGDAMLRADWHTLSDQSASEAYWRVVVTVVDAARGHATEAVDFLLSHTAWGRGLVDDSADPARYGNPAWVSKEVERAARKTDAALDRSGPVLRDLAESYEVATLAAPRSSSTSSPWVRTAWSDDSVAVAAPWVVRGWVRQQQVGFLVAAPAVGKSTLAAAWIVAAAWGGEWAGQQVAGGPVLALVGEGRSGFRRRIRAALRLRGLGDAPPKHPFEVVDFRLPLSSPAGRDHLAALVAAFAADHGELPRLIIVDTLSAHWAETENDSEQAAPFMRCLLDIAAHGPSIAVLHHVTKAAGADAMPSLGHLRGSGAFVGQADFVVGLCQPAKGSVQVGGIKCKDDDLPDPLTFELQRVDLGYTEPLPDGTEVQVSAGALSIAPDDSTDAASAEEDLERRILQAIEIAETNDAPCSARLLSEGANKVRGAKHRVLTTVRELKSRGEITASNPLRLLESGKERLKSMRAKQMGGGDFFE